MTTDEPYQQENVGVQHPDPNDELDVMSKLLPAEGSGYWRDIELREGLKISIGDFRLCDRLLEIYLEGEADWLEYHFHFSGEHQTENAP